MSSRWFRFPGRPPRLPAGWNAQPMQPQLRGGEFLDDALAAAVQYHARKPLIEECE